MPSAEIVHIAKFMPERVVRNVDLLPPGSDELAKNPFFVGVEERRFASPDYLSEDLGTLALQQLLKDTGVDASELDLILCSCNFTDHLHMGIASAVQHRVGARRASALNIDNGCTGFVTGLQTARAFIGSGMYKKVALITVTNLISRLTEFQKRPQSYPLGDGASATLLIASEKASILSSVEKTHGENYALFCLGPETRDGTKKRYWETDAPPLGFEFDTTVLTKLQANALSLVPAAVTESLEQAGKKASDVDLLITHQPNQVFMRKWRRRIGVPTERTHDTLRQYGNLFQCSIPVTMADALETGKLSPGKLLALGTFSFGGDLVSAMVLRW
jgi:3-oxoacyl-(acyl-carrier-protein) synthase III